MCRPVKTQAFGYDSVATVLRNGKVRVIVYTRDHPPAHVHIVAPEGHAKILVDGPNGLPTLAWNLGLSKRQLAWALSTVYESREMIMVVWNRIHE